MSATWSNKRLVEQPVEKVTLKDEPKQPTVT